ncbi:hypothetical protein B0H17DRAFT_1138247 [Mycena rosella]|uniref:Uncharacterized protein n=1 Tax=Mycena rosella TaxID=1033263 RepID=A0AAD7G9T4_MYCRO|nr:hypothetical protein B0H17DRAFT_1138247 [Mycena rosella]
MHPRLSRVFSSAPLLLLVAGQALAAPQGAPDTSPADQNLARGVVFLAHCPRQPDRRPWTVLRRGAPYAPQLTCDARAFVDPAGGGTEGEAGLGFKADRYWF